MKIEEQVLSIEQMKHLQELGVDTSDASLAWFMSPNTNRWKIKAKNNFAHELLRRISPERYIPTYTTGDLIEKLPKKLNSDYERIITMNRNIIEVTYEDGWGSRPAIKYNNLYDEEYTLIKILYKTLCWVAKNHKELLKEKK